MADDEQPAPEGPAEHLPTVTPDGAARPRRPRLLALWGVLAVLALAVGVVAVRSGDGGHVSTLPVALGSSGGAGGEPAMAAPAADMARLAWIRYVAGDDLPALGGRGPAYRLVATIDRARVQALATALGLDGAPQRDEDGWHVTGPAGELQVSSWAGSWWFDPQVPDEPVAVDGSAEGDPAGPDAPDASTSSGGPAANVACASGAPTTTIAPDGTRCDDGTPVPPADLPDEATARRIALDLLDATGLDTAHADVTVEGPYDADAWLVAVDPRIDWLPVSGLEASVSVGSKGAVTSASGYLADVERVGDFPLIATTAAVDRLNDEMGGGPGTDVAVDSGSAEGGPSIEAVDPVDPGFTGQGGEVAVDPAGPDDGTLVAPTTLAPPPGGCRAIPGGQECTSSGDGTSGSSGTGYACPAEAPDVVVDEPTPGAAADGPVTTTTAAPATTVPEGAATATDLPACTAPTEPEGAPLTVVLHQAERILTLAPATDGSDDAYLVPAYRFHGDDDSSVEVVALADDALAPVADPCADPVESTLPCPDAAVAPVPEP